MPTNLPPEYYEVEKRYKAAESPDEKAAALEELLSTIPKHKGTDHLRADLRRKLAKLKEAAQQARKKGGAHVSAYRVEREGAGQVVLVGPPNTGKSALVAALTNAEPEVSDAPYTTWKPTPGMMPFENIQIQLVDTPPLNPEYIEPALMDLVRRADLVLLVVDLQTYPQQQLEQSIEILQQHRIIPQHLREKFEGQGRFTFVPLLVLANKCDDQESEEIYDIFCELMEEQWPCLPLSGLTGHNVELFKRSVFERLHVIRVYSKAPGQEPDYNSPFILPQGSTVVEFARKVHLDFYEKLAAARLWGSSLFDGQMVQRDYVLRDGDVVELRI